MNEISGRWSRRWCDGFKWTSNRLLCLGDDFAQLLWQTALRRCRRIRCRTKGFLDFADEHQPAVCLGLKEERGVRDGFGFGGRKLVNQLGMHIARPGPAADVGDALVVDGDDGQAVGGLARGAGAGEVVKAPLQGADQVGGLVQHQNRQHDSHACKPIGAPELSGL